MEHQRRTTSRCSRNSAVSRAPVDQWDLQVHQGVLVPVECVAKQALLDSVGEMVLQDLQELWVHQVKTALTGKMVLRVMRVSAQHVQ